MIEFKPVTIESIGILREYLRGEGRICDNTPGTAVMWREDYELCYAVEDGTLVMRMVQPCGVVTYSYPCGARAEEVCGEIVERNRSRGRVTRFCYMSEETAGELCEKYGGTVKSSRRWADYLYPAENFVSYAGKKLREKRNHMNRFLAEHEDWAFLPIDKDTLPTAREFYLSHMELNEKDSPTARSEARICLEVLDRWADYGFDGGILTAGGKAVGITAGEVIGDTLYVHIEKADREVNGAYQMTASAFVRSFGDRIAYVNREDDSGDEGLRRSKLSYRPCDIIFKHTVEIK